MTVTPDQAIDEMLTVFKTAWDADVMSNGIAVVYPDVSKPITDGSAAWVEAKVQHSVAGEANLFNGDTRRYRNTGFLIFSVYTPFGDGLTLSGGLAKVIINAFENARKQSIIYVSAAPTYVGQVGAWHMTNVIVEFVYDTIR